MIEAPDDLIVGELYTVRVLLDQHITAAFVGMYSPSRGQPLWLRFQIRHWGSNLDSTCFDVPWSKSRVLEKLC